MKDFKTPNQELPVGKKTFKEMRNPSKEVVEEQVGHEYHIKTKKVLDRILKHD
jgi:uncharacterized protein (UPF0216 family)